MEMNFSQLKDSLFHKFVLGKTENDKCFKVSVTTASGCAPQPVGAPTFVPPCRNVSPRRSLHLASVSQLRSPKNHPEYEMIMIYSVSQWSTLLVLLLTEFTYIH